MATGKPILRTNPGREPAARAPMRSLIAREMQDIRLVNGSEELYTLSSEADEQLNVAGDPTARTVVQGFRDRRAGMSRKQQGLPP